MSDLQIYMTSYVWTQVTDFILMANWLQLAGNRCAVTALICL